LSILNFVAYDPGQESPFDLPFPKTELKRMRCPFCREDNDRVIDSRAGDDGHSIRRRRECLGCRRRFTTYERVERQLITVVKKGGERESFDRDKVKRGLAKACWKRPLTDDDLEEIICSLEAELYGGLESEVSSEIIGERLMELLRDRDQIAYVRFASVYREFKDIRDFLEELEPILAQVTSAATAELVGSELSSAKPRPAVLPPKG
jgi:transcriptional repressor NrdR